MSRKRTGHVFGRVVKFETTEWLVTLENGFAFKLTANFLPSYFINPSYLKILVDFDEKSLEEYTAYVFRHGNYGTRFFIGEENIIAEGITCS